MIRTFLPYVKPRARAIISAMSYLAKKNKRRYSFFCSGLEGRLLDKVENIVFSETGDTFKKIITGKGPRDHYLNKITEE